MPAWMLPAAIGVGSALSSFGQSQAADRQADISEAHLEMLKRRYAEQEPLRALGLARLQGKMPERPDQSAAFADPSNAFYQPPQALGFGEGYTNQMPDLDKATKDYRAVSKDSQGYGKSRDDAAFRKRADGAFPGILDLIEGQPKVGDRQKQVKNSRSVPWFPSQGL